MQTLRRILLGAAIGITLWLGLTGRGEEGLSRIRLAIHDAQRLLYAELGWPLPGTPDLSRLKERLAEKGLERGNPVFLRIFKREQELELWMKKGDRFELFASSNSDRSFGRAIIKRLKASTQWDGASSIPTAPTAVHSILASLIFSTLPMAARVHS